MNVARLQDLERELRHPTVTAKHDFYMGSWYAATAPRFAEPALRVDPKTGKCDIVVPKKPKRHLCSSSACALGTAALMPKFRRLGLKLVIDGSDQDEDSDALTLRCYGHVEYKSGNNSYDAAAAFFDIHRDTSVLLFSPDSSIYDVSMDNITRKMVADHIKRLIAVGEDEFLRLSAKV